MNKEKEQMPPLYFDRDDLADVALHEAAHAVCAAFLGVPFTEIYIERSESKYGGEFIPNHVALQQTTQSSNFQGLPKIGWLHIPLLASLEMGHLGPTLRERELDPDLYRSDRDRIDEGMRDLLKNSRLFEKIQKSLRSSIKRIISELADAVKDESRQAIFAVARRLIQQEEVMVADQDVGRRTLLAIEVAEVLDSFTFCNRDEFDEFLLKWNE